MKVGDLLECVEAVPGLLTVGRLYEVLDFGLSLVGVRTDGGETQSLGISYFGHGAGDASGPIDPDCPCRSTSAQVVCARTGCRVCRVTELSSADQALLDMVRTNGLQPAEAELVRAEAAAHDRTVGAQLARIVGDWCRNTQSGALYERASFASSTPPGDGSWSGSTP